MDYIVYSVVLRVLLTCLDAVSADVSSSQKTEFVDKHNELRRLVSPTATNMKKMHWDDDIAAMAQGWADLCTWEHGHPEGLASDFSYVGQNLYYGSGGSDVNGAVQLWYDEVSGYTYSSNSCSGVCGHYTQVVWAASHALGCGIQDCQNGLTGGPNRHVTVIVCNYGPGGNYNGQKPYVSGDSCSACTDQGFTLCDDKLCAGQGSEGSATTPALHHHIYLITVAAALAATLF